MTAVRFSRNISSLLAVSRPRFWLYLGGPVLVGLVWGADTVDDFGSITALVLFVYFLVPANVFLYGVNDYFDAEIDAINPKKHGPETVWEGDTVVRVGVVLSGIIGGFALLVTPIAGWPYLLAFFALAVVYSVPPIRLKARPGLDSISNGLYILPGAAAYVALAGSHPPLYAILGAWVWTMGMHTFSAIPDINPDRTAGIRTTATVLGEQRTLAYCSGCWALAAFAFAIVDIRAGALMGIYPFVPAWLRRIDIPVRRAYWWFPALNAGIGAIFVIAGFWRLPSIPGGIG